MSENEQQLLFAGRDTALEVLRERSIIYINTIENKGNGIMESTANSSVTLLYYYASLASTLNKLDATYTMNMYSATNNLARIPEHVAYTILSLTIQRGESDKKIPTYSYLLKHCSGARLG